MAGLDVPQNIETAAIGHVNIEQHEIPIFAPQRIERLVAAGGFADRSDGGVRFQKLLESRPDNGVIVASYIASWLMAGAFLAVGACISAMTKNQVIAVVVTAALVFVLTVAGSPIVLGVFQGWAPEWLLHGVAQASFLGHFSAITRGVIDLRDLVYFLSIMVAFLAANAILIDLEKAE